jgi:Transposase DDE domain
VSNQGIAVWELFAQWVPQVVGARPEVVVALDWTDFAADGQTTLVLSLVTSHGRATPLLWHTVSKATLKAKRNDYEDRCLVRLAEVLPAGVRVTILADRGFGDHKLFTFLSELSFDYVIRFRGNIRVTDAQDTSRPAAAWVGPGGQARKLRSARVTAAQCPVGAVVCVQAKGMKQPWCLATSDAEASTQTLINYYAKRWTIEPSFRDTKDLRFGLGLSSVRVSTPERRDRLLLLNAFAIVLLTLLGAAGESLGMDRHLKATTAKHRTHSLFRQGCMLYDLIPNMTEARLRPLVERFSELMLQHRAFAQTFSIA